MDFGVEMLRSRRRWLELVLVSRCMLLESGRCGRRGSGGGGHLVEAETSVVCLVEKGGCGRLSCPAAHYKSKSFVGCRMSMNLCSVNVQSRGRGCRVRKTRWRVDFLFSIVVHCDNRIALQNSLHLSLEERAKLSSRLRFG